MTRIFAIITFLMAGVTSPVLAEPDTKEPEASQTLACEIFRKRGDWYEAARQTEVRWGVPASHQLALITEEWNLKSGKIPAKWKPSWWFSPSNPRLPEGYFASTWKQYQFHTGQKNISSNDIHDVLDFMGWYLSTLSSSNNISPYDPVAQYIVWRHGPDAYNSGAWQSNLWMKLQAEAFAKRSREYHASLQTCQDELDTSWASKLSSISQPWSWKQSGSGRKGYGKPGYAPNASISSK